MFEKIREGLREVISIADECPERFQAKCFELLLTALINNESPPEHSGYMPVQPSPQRSHSEQLPMFFKQAGISEAEIQTVFHDDGGTHQIIVSDLKAKTTSQKQVRLALLLGIQQLMDHNEALVPRDNLVTLCKQYSAHDASNFATYMRGNKSLFLPKGNGWTLTVPGQQKAAELIKELAP